MRIICLLILLLSLVSAVYAVSAEDVLVVDCTARTVTRRPLTAQETARLDQDRAEGNLRRATEQVAEAQRQADIAALRSAAATNSQVAAILRLLRIESSP
jgi:hypothetical protein